MTKSGSQKSKSPSQLIDARIKELGDWRSSACPLCSESDQLTAWQHSAASCQKRL